MVALLETGLPVNDRPSDDHGPRRGDGEVRFVVLHYTDTETLEESLRLLTTSAREASSHYLIDEDGTLYRLVAEAQRAWHAGLSTWHGVTDVNSHSIGIELQNPGHRCGYRSFPEAQMRALEALLTDILGRYRLPPEAVVAHSDIAPDRKRDPGELFDWRRLAAKGLAIVAEGPPLPPDAAAATRALRAIGYGIAGDAELPAVLAAFQRRFRPERIDGQLDAETMGLIAVLAGEGGIRLGDGKKREKPHAKA